MQNLIERLEKATGPSFELECAISRVISPPGLSAPPNYTASLDDALTLVPDNWGADVGFPAKPGTGGQPWASVWPKGYGNERNENHVNAATMPLALCIAALKARATATQRAA